MTDDLDALDRELLALDATLCRDSFSDFVRLGWNYIEPNRPMLLSHAIDALCAALQAVAERRITKLAIACPPGVCKSLIAAVAFPAWLLLRSIGRARVMVGSYSHSFAERDARRCRDLVGSAWFRSLVNAEWSVDPNADKRDDFWTTRKGRRLIVSPGGRSLGERCTFQIVDDALSGADVHSRAAKLEATRWVCEMLSSRLEDIDTDPRVVIGQRLSVDDPIASVLERGWSYLVLPATLSDDDVPCELRDDAGALVWRDPRAPGEPLVSLLDVAAQQSLRTDMGSRAYNTQYNQKPTDDSLAILKRSWWRFHHAEHCSASSPRPAGCDEEQPAVATPTSFSRVVIAADLTFGSAKGDFAVVQAWGASRGGRYLLDQWRARAGFEEQVAAIKTMAAKYPNAKVLIEKAANGAAVIETLRKDIAGVIAVKPIGSKAARLAASAPAVESGACYLPLGVPWLEDLVEELAGATKHDDASDTAAYALNDLAHGDIEALDRAQPGFTLQIERSFEGDVY